jgi:hypothetical protein
MADEPTTPATGDQPKETPPTPPPSEPLGDAGKKALDEERRARREAEARLKELEPLAKRAQEMEESQKTEAQKLADANRVLEDRASKAEAQVLRLGVCVDKGLPLSMAGRLNGGSKEELEADADELLLSFKAGTDAQPPVPPGGRPKERLRPGAVPDAEPDPDRAEVIAAIPRF